ncbi:hypothetical protein DQP55_02560 [Mycolicibacterium sp. GF69]|uniref:PepSY domain-containing protein n=1 Tax=Mycolicibacterium sp. GF69 TaxID=2267251 RepID=UPI000DCE7EE6|nr:PepSY domain-containing protein [Mycolicibacterium sp. GF69]RAV18451.1 hypothetical protein DQP55_02560 [Mycolicibacterium sp. GF69]
MAVAGTLALALVLSGCSNDSQTEQPTTTPTAETGTTTETTTATTSVAQGPAPAPGGGDSVSVAAAQEALNSAARAVPNGRPFGLEVENRNGRKVFEVKVASDGNEIKVLVGEDGKQVISQNQASAPSDDVTKVQDAQVDAVRAVQAAAEREADATVSEIEIDTENGVLVWEVQLVRPDGSEVQLDVDAQTGAVR